MSLIKNFRCYVNSGYGEGRRLYAFSWRWADTGWWLSLDPISALAWPILAVLSYARVGPPFASPFSRVSGRGLLLLFAVGQSELLHLVA